MLKRIASLFISLVVFQTASANMIYQIPQNSQEMLKFSIPYSLGTHNGTIRTFQGIVQTTDADEVLDAHFQVSIDDMQTGNSTRDCHMREALGLDYTKSQFPRIHVCDGDLLPYSGPDSVQYPTITVDAFKMLSSTPFTVGVPQNVNMNFNITLHGVTKTYSNEAVAITKMMGANNSRSFHIVKTLNLSLKDFGIQVKPFKMGPIKIGVGDTVTIVLNARMVSY